MPFQEKSAGSPPFEIITSGKSKKIGKTGMIIGISTVVFLILSVIAGVLLVRQQQNVAEKAASDQCPGAEACPYSTQPNLLRSCHPADSDGTPTDSVCVASAVGWVKICGSATTKYCCSAGGSWTTDMTDCPTSPTPTATPTPTPTPSVEPNSCGGTCGSNSNCTSGLYCYQGYCRNPSCSSQTDCNCPATTSTPTSTPIVTSASTVTPIATQTTPLPIPTTGTGWPTIVGAGVGVFVVVGSILLIL